MKNFKMGLLVFVAIGLVACGKDASTETLGGGSPVSAPVIKLTANPNIITINDSMDLSWTVTNATACTASDGWSGGKNESSGTESVGPIAADTTFTLSCSGAGGQVKRVSR